MKSDVKTSVLAFFYNNPPSINQIIDEFNIGDKQELGLDVGQIDSIKGILEKIFSPSELKKNAKELKTLKTQITSCITDQNYNLENNTLNEKIKKFKNFWDFTNFIGNILCLPISKILRILYCNIKFQKFENKFNLKTKRLAKVIYEPFYSKSINLSPEITIENKTAHTFALKVKKAFIFTTCLVAILALPILIGLGIILKLIAQKKDPSIKEDYEKLKDFFKPQDIILGSEEGYIQNFFELEGAFKDKNLNNKIIDKLTIYVLPNNFETSPFTDVLIYNSVMKIKNLFLKTLVLKIKGCVTKTTLKDYNFEKEKFKRSPMNPPVNEGVFSYNDPTITFTYKGLR